jgi:hypothetical protein
MLDIHNKLTYHWHIIRGQVNINNSYALRRFGESDTTLFADDPHDGFTRQGV